MKYIKQTALIGIHNDSIPLEKAINYSILILGYLIKKYKIVAKSDEDISEHFLKALNLDNECNTFLK